MREDDRMPVTSEAIESQLAALTPIAPAIDRDALMYQAGYQAARGVNIRPSTSRFWQGATGVMTAATVALAVMLARQNTSTVVPSPVAEVEQAATPDETAVVAAPAVEPDEAVAEDEPRKASRPNPLLLADPTSNYLALRAVVLERGVETWPTDFREPELRHTPGQAPRSSTVRNLLQEVLPAAPEPRKDDLSQPTEASTTDEETIA